MTGNTIALVVTASAAALAHMLTGNVIAVMFATVVAFCLAMLPLDWHRDN